MADPKHPRHYDEAFKRRIVQLYENGKPPVEIEREYDISHSTLHRWMRGIRNSGSTRAVDNRTPERNELIALRRQTAGWRWRWMFQNKRRRYSHESMRDTVRCRPLPDIGVVRDPGRAEVDILLDARPPRDRTDRPHEEDVGRVWRDSGRVYGAGRIKAALEHERIVMSRRRINRIMKAGGHGRLVFEGPAPNILGREFDGYAPRAPWPARPCRG